MKHCYTLFLATALLWVNTSSAQTSYKDSTRFYEHAYVGMGYSSQSFPGFNAVLTRYFPQSIPTDVISFHYGGKSAFNQFLVQGDALLAIGSKGRRKTGVTSVGLLSIGIDAGVFLFKPGNVRVYPFAGISLDVPMVTASVKTSDIVFDSVLANPMTRQRTEPMSFNNFFVGWRSGLAIDFGKGKKSNQPYTMGIRAGYKQSFNTGRWTINGDGNFRQAPTDRLTQWFGSIVFYSPIHKQKQRKR